ncbi:hypothetical protein LTR37_015688 [Vermiconidia calcicola]|uniref:Uncharacterized protein n=1 Tax=Vermiconidia calcicola TaxID=1690605 RepID=A0ACC3MQ40_9PEZI|nr:hypothetical protein LTR37_015688 [Vermiconidia calcicola]
MSNLESIEQIRHNIRQNVETMSTFSTRGESTTAEWPINITKSLSAGDEETEDAITDNEGEDINYRAMVLLDMDGNFVRGPECDDVEEALRGLFVTTCEALHLLIRYRLQLRGILTPNGSEFLAS